MSHPWQHIPSLIECGAITAEEANENIIFAQRSTLRRAFRDLQAALLEMSVREEISPQGVERIQRIIVSAQADEAPDV